jgi:hypothetical protein
LKCAESVHTRVEREDEDRLGDTSVSSSKGRVSDGCVNTGNVKSMKETEGREIVDVIRLADGENEEVYMKHARRKPPGDVQKLSVLFTGLERQFHCTKIPFLFRCVFQIKVWMPNYSDP